MLLQVSCNNEIKINAPWKEVIVIYGLLDPNDKIHEIRVSKAFQNINSSAFSVAKISDSFILDTIIVSLKNLNTGEIFILKPQFSTPKDPGIFANDKNPIYVYNSNLTGKPILPGTPYEIEAFNPISGIKASAKTTTLSNAIFNAPVTENGSIFNVINSFSFAAKTGENAFTYDCKMYFHIKEWDILSGDTIRKILRWDYINNLTGFNPQGTVIQTIPRLSLSQFLSASLIKNANKYRVLEKLDFVTFGANQVLYDFISLNKPSIGIVQKQADYTNIVGGFGIFGSRTEQWIYNCKPNNALIGLLIRDLETKDLNFQF